MARRLRIPDRTVRRFSGLPALPLQPEALYDGEGSTPSRSLEQSAWGSEARVIRRSGEEMVWDMVCEMAVLRWYAVSPMRKHAADVLCG